MKRLRYLLLTLMVLGGQFALLAHGADLNSHAGGAECQVCLHAPAADSGLTPTAPAVAVVRPFVSPVAGRLPAAVTTTPRPFAARGPPFSA